MFNHNRILKILFFIFTILILLCLVLFFTHKSKSAGIPAEFDSLNVEKQQTLFTNFAQNNPALAWQFLKQKYVVNDQITQDVHSFAHIVGNSSYQKMGIDGVKICDATFNYGCFHGVTQSMVADIGIENISQIEKSCRKYFGNQSDFLTGCIHGTGHGLFEAENYNLDASLNDCKAFSVTFQNNCFDGVFMEYSENPQIYQDTNFVKICSEGDSVYLTSCSKYVYATFGNLHNWQTDKIATECSKISQPEVLQECFYSLGSYAVYQAKGTLDTIQKICSEPYDISNHSYCIIGAVRQLVSQNYLNYAETADKLCKSVKINSQLCQSLITPD